MCIRDSPGAVVLPVYQGKGKPLSIRERDGVKSARKLLFGELAAALNLSLIHI